MREKHLLDDASAEDMSAFARNDLRQYASLLGMKYVNQLNKDELIVEIIKARDAEKARQESSLDEPCPLTQQNLGTPVGDAEELGVDGKPIRKITPDEARRIEGASDEAIREWFDKRPDLHPCLSEYAWMVLARRADLRARERQRQELESVMDQYEVTKGGRIVVNSLPTMLPKGSVVSAQTHNLEWLTAQGIEVRKIARAVTVKDEFGLSHTQIELE